MKKSWDPLEWLCNYLRGGILLGTMKIVTILPGSLDLFSKDTCACSMREQWCLQTSFLKVLLCLLTENVLWFSWRTGINFLLTPISSLREVQKELEPSTPPNLEPCQAKSMESSSVSSKTKLSCTSWSGYDDLDIWKKTKQNSIFQQCGLTFVWN